MIRKPNTIDRARTTGPAFPTGLEFYHLSYLKEQAVALQVGLLGGYVQPTEVVTWADQVIAAGDVPGPDLIEISLGAGLPVEELAQALKAIPGEVGPTRLAQTILRHMAAALRRDPTTSRSIARCLYQMWLDDLTPSPEAKDQMSRLDDAFDLAESGTWGTLTEVRAELAEFLSVWAG